MAIFKGLCHLSREIVSAQKIDFSGLFYVQIWWSWDFKGEVEVWCPTNWHHFDVNFRETVKGSRKQQQQQIETKCTNSCRQTCMWKEKEVTKIVGWQVSDQTDCHLV